ncbi:MAG: SPOR domain-containing protein [Pseudomonadota bacterium]
MINAVGIRFSIFVGLAVALTACEDGQGPSFDFLKPKSNNTAAQQDGASAAAGEEIEVEAPDVFGVTEAGLWDGRPSLGGVWVAYPDVRDPERVIIRNSTNGQSVIGALFRRERENPGPSLQVSSDAAEELGLVAGQPTVLEVVALRTRAAPIIPELAIADEPDVQEDDDTETTEADDEIAVAPIETQELGSTADIANAPEADPIAAASAAITETALPVPESASSAPAATATPAPAPAPVSSASGLSKPFIQIGIFSIETNADNTATSLKGIGILPTVKAQSSQGKKFWRVVVGPSSTSAERADLLRKIKSLGFEDAYFVTN